MTIDPTEAAKATADAVKATAEAASQGLSLVEKSGDFLARIFGDALAEYGASWKDRASHFRWKNTLKIADEVEAIIKARRVEDKVTPIPMAAAIPLIEGATLEDEPTLQRMWAELIANAATMPDQAREMKIFANVLAAMTPFDAQMLQWESRSFDTASIHRKMEAFDRDRRASEFSVNNLRRLGLLEWEEDPRFEELVRELNTPSGREYGPKPSSLHLTKDVHVSAFGRAFLAACSSDT